MRTARIAERWKVTRSWATPDARDTPLIGLIGEASGIDVRFALACPARWPQAHVGHWSAVPTVGPRRRPANWSKRSVPGEDRCGPAGQADARKGPRGAATEPRAGCRDRLWKGDVTGANSPSGGLFKRASVRFTLWMTRGRSGPSDDVAMSDVRRVISALAEQGEALQEAVATLTAQNAALEAENEVLRDEIARLKGSGERGKRTGPVRCC